MENNDTKKTVLKNRSASGSANHSERNIEKEQKELSAFLKKSGFPSLSKLLKLDSIE